ncbi:peptidase MA family metallohydrolase [Kutzneria kofuensis]|uniref:Peptidase MA-like domain-containing protein n=1 Tax=Kutzneria kofuensis TaxID=103725 RepID=A0A7W9NFF2_9PSEU|nr:hypothetical protein [Kutzneria kofuensis]MBB5890454.1 hypothetical protein [Kutzneria kofuensis]
MTGTARFRAWLVAAIAVTLFGGVVLLVGQPATGPGPAAPSTGSPTGQGAPPLSQTGDSEVTALLRSRAAAVLHRDRQAFLATIDPRATPQFRDAQAAMFDNLADVPLSVWSYDLDPTDVVTVPKGAFPAEELWAPEVQLNYALAGVDRDPTSKPMGYLFSRHGTRWFLASDTLTSRNTWRGPWDFGPVTALRAKSGLVLTHPDDADLGRRIAGELDSDVAAVSAVWDQPWPREVAVLVPDSTDELKAFVGPEFAVDSIAAVAVADRVDNGNHTAIGQRVVLNPDNATKMPVASLRVVLRHEMTHIAARGYTVDGTPMWMLEGFANYVGYRDSGIPLPVAAADVAELERNGTPPTDLPSNGDFAADGDKINLAYDEAWTLTSFIADTFGQHALVTLYLRIAGGSPKADVGAQLHDVLGVDRAGLIAGWQDYLRRKF